jgi:hypothetical protein
MECGMVGSGTCKIPELQNDILVLTKGLWLNLCRGKCVYNNRKELPRFGAYEPSYTKASTLSKEKKRECDAIGWKMVKVMYENQQTQDEMKNF